MPLDGLRVLEFAHAVMGPCCGLLLADIGADVIQLNLPAEIIPGGYKALVSVILACTTVTKRAWRSI